MDITSYLLGKESGGGTPINNQDKNVTITENGTTTVTADTGYTGLGTVGITTNVSAGISEYFTTEITNQNKSDFKNIYIKKFPAITVDSNVTDLSNAFYYWPYTSIDLSNLDTSNVTNMYSLFAYSKLSSLDVSNLDTSKVTNMSNMFSGCDQLTSLDITDLDTSNVIDMSNMFSIASNIQTLGISGIDTSKLINANYMFSNMYNLTELDMTGLDLSKVESVQGMFALDWGLKTIIGNFDMSSCTEFMDMFSSASVLEDLPTFSNIGKAFPLWVSANAYTFDVSACTALTHTSLMNIINGLYDLATAGVATQDLVLGETNLAKLSQAEQDIATNKGWTIS